MWGQLDAGGYGNFVERNTPTYVGTTQPRGFCPRAGTEHPHVCGDNFRMAINFFVVAGTPPRMWGQRTDALFPADWPRNTPTYVGTTCCVRRSPAMSAEHPHVCGDNYGYKLDVMHDGGTPPRMWGQPRPARLRWSPTRNTPTYVGTTRVNGTAIKPVEEHPHVCGDNPVGAGAIFDQEGTPPRMWGQPASNAQQARVGRNTPTYVGTTDLSPRPVPLSEHPHVCGDNFGMRE